MTKLRILTSFTISKRNPLFKYTFSKDDIIDLPDEHVPFILSTGYAVLGVNNTNELYKLSKSEQVEILTNLGYVNIPRTERERVELILKLQAGVN